MATWQTDLVDALPYVDQEYADPGLKKEVERLIDEEMGRSSRRPADFLLDLPPLPSSNLEQDCPMVAKALERLRAGRPPVALDMSRYGVQAPPVGKRNDLYEWAEYIRNAKVQLQHQTIKHENLELMNQYSANIWRAHNQCLESFNSRLQSSTHKLSLEIESLNRDRKLNQQAAAAVLSHLDSQWKELCSKNTDIELACIQVEKQVEELASKRRSMDADEAQARSVVAL